MVVIKEEVRKVALHINLLKCALGVVCCSKLQACCPRTHHSYKGCLFKTGGVGGGGGGCFDT